LPLDAKFPQEDYLRLVEAQENADADAAEEAARQLERTVKEMAKAIRDKYLDPPYTTDFGIMFLPTEGLYAEVLRRPGLAETLQRDCKVLAAGPTTLAALLNSLQMGFRTLAIEKRSAEVWTLLGAVRTEFSKFGVVLEKTSKKLQEAGNHIDQAAIRTRAIERRLRDVQELPRGEAEALLDMPEMNEGNED
jgi:DNA recombination protein RmuC